MIPMSNSFPAWPRRPPLWTSVACLVSAFLAVSYGFITVRSTTPVQAAFLPAYLQSAIWSVLPPAPRFRRNTPYVHRFTLPHRASITIPPQLLYLQLQRRVFQGQSIRQLFAHALAASVSTSLLLIVIGASLDRAHESKSRAGRPSRGPQIVTGSVAKFRASYFRSVRVGQVSVLD